MTLQELIDQNRVEKITEFNIGTILAELDENGIDLVIVNILPFFDHLSLKDGMYHLNYDSFAPEEIMEVLLGFNAVYKIKGEKMDRKTENQAKNEEQVTLNVDIPEEQIEGLFKVLMGEEKGSEFFRSLKEMAEEVAEEVISNIDTCTSSESDNEEDEYCEECETEEVEITLGDVILEILERIEELDEKLDRIENKVDVLLGESLKGCCRRHQ